MQPCAQGSLTLYVCALQLTLLVKQYFTERSDPVAELQFRDFLQQKAVRCGGGCSCLAADPARR